jgi:hypothetical protein
VGTGVFNATFNDNVANAVTFNFSNSNAADDILVNRGASGNQNDVYLIGNGGTPLTNQFLTITNNGNLVNTDTINFGSGTNVITDVAHNGGVNSIHNYVNTVANGAFLNLATADTVQSWTSIANTALFGHDTLLFQQDPVNTVINTGPAASVSAGLLNGLLTFAPHEAGSFHFGGNTYVFDHADASTAFTAHDSLVEIAGNAVATLGTVNTSHVITLLA